MSVQASVPQTNVAKPMTVTRQSGKRDATQRIAALDFTKGALVLLMVLYHWINYFIGPQWPYYFYLRFLTPSFIFISGFVITHVYLSKYDPADVRLPKRLLVRGLKLLVIFAALNVGRSVVLPMLSSGSPVADPLALKNILAVYVTGNLPNTTKLVSFSILVPIAYLLMFSAALMVPMRRHRYTFHVACAFLLALISSLAYFGITSENLEFVTVGMLGALVGFMPISAINNIGKHPFSLAVAYVLYIIAITIWNVPFPLLIVGVFLSVGLIYWIGAHEGAARRIRNETILLGKYSLFGYISQIVILQLLHAGLRRFSLGIPVLAISFLAAFALTVISVEVVDRARATATSVDKLYKVVFA